MRDSPLHKLQQAHTGRREQRRFSYAYGILGGTIASLLLVIFLFRVPISTDQVELGWQVKSGMAPMTLHDLKERIEPIAAREVHNAPIQTSGAGGEAQNQSELVSSELGSMLAGAAEEKGEGEDGSLDEQRDSPIEMNRLQLRMQPDDRLPRLEGGMGSLYLHIRYPEAARRAGIQGLMVMQFVVEEDGTPTNIQVKQSLHPLTDSSAVQALRRVTFVPGRMSGENIRVRMNLPVRFSLINADGSRYESDEPVDLTDEALSHFPNLDR